MMKMENSEKGFTFAWIIMLIVCIIGLGHAQAKKN